jgi:formylglycine-generating enzyme required for sulfatase activity
VKLVKPTWSCFLLSALLLVTGLAFADGGVFQIFPSGKRITVETRPGYSYQHVEGNSPDWRLGRLREVVHKRAPVAGDGQAQFFETTSSAAYHLVEETLITGRVQLDLKGTYRSGFSYFIRRGDEAFVDGEVREHELSALPSIHLPPGDYTMEAVAVGYGTPRPIPFSIKHGDEAVRLPLQLVPNRILLFTRTSPPNIASGERAVLRKLDPVKQKELWHQQVSIEGNAIALSEGLYELEFPPVAGYSNTERGTVTRFELTDEDHSRTVVGDYLRKSGELLVTVETSESVEQHLADVSFSLIDSDGMRTRYPKAGEYVDRSVAGRRTFLLRDLSPGTYTIAFDVDKRTFTAPASSRVTVGPEHLGKFEQYLEAKPGSIEARLVLPQALAQSGEEPRITLRDADGRFIKRSSGHELLAANLRPGRYELSFEPVSGYETPEPVEIQVRPGHQEGPFLGRYDEGSGLLVASVSTGPRGERLENVKLVLSDQQHHRYVFPGNIELPFESRVVNGGVREFQVYDLPAGVYSVDWEVPNYDNLFREPAANVIVVNKGQTTRYHQDIQARYGALEAAASLPEGYTEQWPRIELKDHTGVVCAESRDGHLIAKDLVPGNYQLVFGEHPDLAAPPPIPVKIEPLLTAGPYHADYSPKTGTLVVKYSTGTHADRLDKVRFWVSNDAGFRDMFPKDGQVIDQPDSKMRTVVIDDLPQGSYSVQFLLPNADGLFASVPDRRVTVSRGHVAELAQMITPRYGSIEASIEALPDDPKLLHYPKITVRDQYDSVIAESWDGVIAVSELMPGEYWVAFEAIEGYETPDSVRVTVESGRKTQPVIGRYGVSTGTLVLVYDTDPKPKYLDEVQVKLIDLKDGRVLSPLVGARKDRVGTSRRLSIPDLPVGRYLVSFSVPGARNLFPGSTDREVQVRADDINQVTQQLRPSYGGLEAGVKVAHIGAENPTPKIFLQDADGRVILQDSGHLVATELPPGKYVLVYEKLDGFLTPDPVEVRVSPNEIAGPYLGQYALNSGRLKVSYQTGLNPEHLDKVRFWISNDDGFRRLYPFGSEYIDDELSGARTVVIDDLELGNYSIEFYVPELASLFADVPSQHFTVQAGKTVEIAQDFQPQYGSVTAYLELPQALIDRRQVPKITLRNDMQGVVAESKSGILEVADLIPGQYLLAYENLENTIAPEAVKVDVAPDMRVGPFVGKYSLRAGKLVVSYGTGPKQERLDRVRFWLIDEQNHRKMYPTSQGGFTIDSETGRRSVEISNLVEGNYRLEFLVPNVDELFSQVPRREVFVRSGEVTEVSEDIVPHYGGVDVSLHFPQRRVGGLVPQIQLKDRVGRTIELSETGDLNARDLAPGRYEIAFEEVQGYDTPESIFVQVERDAVSGPYFGTYNLAVGAMVVNYDTAHRADLLDKVRFWVVNENNSGAMYPSGDNFINDEARLRRKVIIPDLPAGLYHVDFLLPDLNGLFSEVERQTYRVRQGEVTTVQQSFLPRFATIEAMVSGYSPVEGDFPPIALKDSLGRIVSESVTGQLRAEELIPGDYTLEFAEIPDFSAPEPVALQVAPADHVGPFVGEYRQHLGDLIVHYSTGELHDQLHQISFTLTDENGQRKTFPDVSSAKKVLEDGSIEVHLAGCPVGAYTVEYNVPLHEALFEAVDTQTVVIKHGKTQYLDQQIEPRYGALEIVANFPEDFAKEHPGIVLRDPVTKEVKARSTDGFLKRDVVMPGGYEVVFEDSSELYVPDNFIVSVAPGRKTGPLNVDYERATGSLTVAYTTGTQQERLDQVRFYLIDDKGQTRSFPSEEQPALVYSMDGQSVHLENIPAGDYTLEFFVPNLDGLFSEPKPLELLVAKDEHVEVMQEILPHYARLDAQVDIPAGMERYPRIELRDKLGVLRASSSEGELSIDTLRPDTYVLSYERLENYSAPLDQVIEVKEFQKLGPFLGQYQAGSGDLSITYASGAKRERLDEVRMSLINKYGERQEIDLAAEAHELSDGVTRRVVLSGLEFGEYTLEASVPNADALFAFEGTQTLFLKTGEEKSIHCSFEPNYASLGAELIFPQGMEDDSAQEISLFNEEGILLAQASSGSLNAEGLVPGIYTLAFAESDQLYGPEPLRIAVAAGETVGPVRAEYTPAKGSARISFNLGDAYDYLDLVRVTLTDAQGEEIHLPHSSRDVKFKADGSAELKVKDLALGDYTASFRVKGDNGLFAAAEPQQFSVRKDQESQLVQTLTPQYASIHAKVGFEQVAGTPKRLPRMELREVKGRLLAESDDGELQVGHLEPGTYVLSCEAIVGLIEPVEQRIEVSANERKDVLAQYGQRYGTVEAFAVLPDGASQSDYPLSIRLIDENGALVLESQGLHLFSERVVPGVYKLEWQGHDALHEPKSETIIVNADTTSPTVMGNYHHAFGELHLAFDVGEAEEYLKDVSVVLRDCKGCYHPLAELADETSIDGCRCEMRLHQLPVGEYEALLSIDRAPGLTASLKTVPLSVKKNETISFNYSLEGDFASLQAGVAFIDAVEQPATLPSITLLDETGRALKRAEGGRLQLASLLPGRYTLKFAELDGFDAPEPQHIELHPGLHMKDLVGEYVQQFGALEVLCSAGDATEKLEGLSLTLWNAQGNASSFVPADQLEVLDDGKEVRLKLDRVAVGSYQLELHIPSKYGLFQSIDAESVRVDAGQTLAIEHELRPHYGTVIARTELDASFGALVEGKAPNILLVDEKEEVIARGEGGNLSVDRLAPGPYKVYYQAVEGFKVPAAQEIFVKPDQVLGPVTGFYGHRTGTVSVSYATGKYGEFLDDISFTLSLADGTLVGSYPVKETWSEADLERQVIIEDLPVGEYSISFLLPESKGLLPARIDPIHIDLEEGQVERIEQAIVPQYGGIEVALNIPAAIEAEYGLPKIQVFDAEGTLVRESTDGYLMDLEMAPGNYDLVYEDMAACFTPDATTVTVAPREISGPFLGQYTQATGSLVVAYHTGPKNERLDQVGFWIVDSKGRRKSYSPEEQIVVASDFPGREVVVPELAVGDYQIFFNVPNADGLFGAMPSQDFSVAKSERVVLEAGLQPRYAGLTISTEMIKELRQEAFEAHVAQAAATGTDAVTINPKTWGPGIDILDAEGRVVASSTSGELALQDLCPGEYHIVFEDFPGCKQPEPVTLRLRPEEMKAPVVHHYEKAKGALLVRYDTGESRIRLHDVAFTLIDEKGQERHFPIEEGFLPDRTGQGCEVAIRDLAVGNYTLRFDLPNDDELFAEPIEQKVSISRDHTTEVGQSFDPRFGDLTVDLGVELPEKLKGQRPEMRLLDAEGKTLAVSGQGRLQQDRLLPGTYTLQFASLHNYYQPEPVVLELAPGDVIGPLPITYEVGKGSAHIAYKTGEKRERIDRVRFWLVDEAGNRELYPREEDFVDDESGYREVRIDGLPLGSYKLEWVLPNQDGLFPEMEISQIVVPMDEEVEWSEFIQPQYGSLDIARDLALDLDEDQPEPEMWINDTYGTLVAKVSEARAIVEDLLPGTYSIVYQQAAGFETPEPRTIEVKANQAVGPIMGSYHPQAVSLSIVTNEDKQHWRILQNGVEVVEGYGTQNRVSVPPGKGYTLDVPVPEGYEVETSPAGTFKLLPGQEASAEVKIKRKFGALRLEADAWAGEVITARLLPFSLEPEIVESLTAGSEGLQGFFGHVPTGSYRVELDVPSYYEPVPVQEVEVFKDDTLALQVQLKPCRALTIHSNAEASAFELTNELGESVVKTGKEVSFEGLRPGRYGLAFGDDGKGRLMPPPGRTIEILPDQDLTMDVLFRRSASLVVSSNVDNYKLRIEGVDDKGLKMSEEILDATEFYTLPEGRYVVYFEALEGPLAVRYGNAHPEPVEVNLSALRPERVHGEYEVASGSLVVTSNLPNATYTVRDISDSEGLVLGRFTGDYSVIPMTFLGEYEVTFDSVANYDTPAPQRIRIESEQRRTLGGYYTPRQLVVHIDAGVSLLGDTFGEGADDERPVKTVELDGFSMGLYEVTASQYAAWLSKAQREGQITYEPIGPRKGSVVDTDGRLLCVTKLAEAASPLLAKENEDGWFFLAAAGQEEHPMVCVSWYGAMAYCQDQGYRLPTEAEWEKAASVQVSKLDGTVKKYRYGFGSDEIDNAFCNYLDSYDKAKYRELGTSVVGFYNGINLMGEVADASFDATDILERAGTREARSPWGTYDMSGNVREWTSDWYSAKGHSDAADRNPTGAGHGTLKVTKGGCYDSFAYEVRTAARWPMAPEKVDQHTGFRVVLSD